MFCHRLIPLAFRLVLTLAVAVAFVAPAPRVGAAAPPVHVSLAAPPIAFGEMVGGHIDAGESQSYSFAAQAGDRVLVAATTVSGSLWPRIRVYAPGSGGTPFLTSENTTRAEIVGTLPKSGTYTILVDDGFNGTLTGDYRLFVQRLNHPGQATPTSFGATLTGEIDGVGAFETFTIAAFPGDTLLLAATKSSGTLWPQVRLYDASGNPLGSDATPARTEVTATLGSEYEVMVPLVWNDVAGVPASVAAASPGAGLAVSRLRTLTILVDSGSSGVFTGTYSLYVQRLNNPGAATGASFGQTIAGETIAPVGEVDTYTFWGQAGDTILVAGTKSADALWPQLRLYDPGGSQLAWAEADIRAEITRTLTTSGNHMLLVDSGFTGALTGTYSIYLERLNDPGAPTTASFGQTISDTAIALVGEMDAYTFAAEEGDKLLIAATRTITGFWPEARLYDPEGRFIASTASDIHVEMTCALADAGDYTLLMTSGFTGALTGGYSLYVQRLNNPGAAMEVSFGQTVTGTVTPIGEVDAYTFSAQAGDTILVAGTKSADALWPHLRLYDPGGSQLAWAEADIRAEITQTLTTSGDYLLLVDSGFTRALTGTYTIYVERLNDPGAPTAAPFGHTISGASVSLVGEMDAYTFSAEAGDTVLIAATRTITGFWPEIRLYDPDGRQLASAEADTRVEMTCTLTDSGDYTLLVNSGFTGALTGGYSLYVQRLNNPGNVKPIPSEPPYTDTVALVGEVNTYTIGGIPGSGALIALTADKVEGALWPRLRWNDPSGVLLDEDEGDIHAEVTSPFSASGNYVLLVDSGFTGVLTGTYALSFMVAM